MSETLNALRQLPIKDKKQLCKVQLLSCQAPLPSPAEAGHPIAQPLVDLLAPDPDTLCERECRQVFAGAPGHLKGSMELGDGRLMSWSAQSVQLWEKEDAALCFQQPLSCWSIAGVRMLPDGRLAIWHTLSGDIHLWDPNTQVISSFTAHEHTVYDVVVLTDDTLVSCSLDGTARIWDYPALRLRQTIVLARDPVKHITALNAQQILLSNPPYGETVLVWDLATHENVWEITANQAWTHPEGVIVTEHFGEFGIWSDSYQRLAQWTHEPGYAHHIHFLPDQQVLLSQPNSPHIHIVDMYSGVCQHSWQAHHQGVQRITEVAQGKWLSYAREAVLREEADHTLALWQEGSWQEVWRVDVGAPVLDTLVLPNHRLLVIRQDTHLGQSMPVYDLHTGQQTHLLRGHTAPVNGARLLSDGRLLSWAQDQTLRTWEI